MKASTMSFSDGGADLGSIISYDRDCIESFIEHRKHQVTLKKLLEKEQKRQLKAHGKDQHLPRAFFDATGAEKKDAVSGGDTLPSYKISTRSIASQIVKDLSFKRPLRIWKVSHCVEQSASPADPPASYPGDLKWPIRAFLDRSPPTLCVDAAELPAELSQNTPFQNATRTQDNEPEAALDDTCQTVKKVRLLGFKAKSDVSPPSRSMRCAKCQILIRPDQFYYHCPGCEHPDRVLCSLCGQAGCGCSHTTSAEVRSEARIELPDGKGLAARTGERSHCKAQDGSVTAGEVNLAETLQEDISCQAEALVEDQVPFHNTTGQRQSRERFSGIEGKLNADGDHVGETELGQYDRVITSGETELTLLDEETAVRERQSLLKEQQQLFVLLPQSVMAKRTEEASAGVGARFQDIATDDHVKRYGTKRKAGGDGSSISPSNPTMLDKPSLSKRSPNRRRDSNDEEEEETAGTPKKVKPTLNSLRTPERLFACPYSKFDRSRYSEHNRHEKNYRGCSSGYWPDISRLKQHLYRVHWRGIHCVRCYAKFENNDLLQAHMRSEPCGLADCPYPEKFDDVQYNEIKTKRPGMTPEEVWHTIYRVLFPGQAKPDSPYADDVATTTSLSTPSPHALECQRITDALGDVFKSRLDQNLASPSHAWLRAPQAREFIHQQLRASVAEVFERLTPASGSAITDSSVEVSPHSSVAANSARTASYSLTPVSSVSASPLYEHSRRGARPNPQLPYFDHRQSFSRALSPRTYLHGTAVQQAPTTEPMQLSANQIYPDVGSGSAEVAFFPPSDVDQENDPYDDECSSLRHGDDLGLAMPTSFQTGSNTNLPSRFVEVGPWRGPTMQPPVLGQGYIPAYHSRVPEPRDAAGSTSASQLKTNHPIPPPINSGYGSVGQSSVRSAPCTGPPASKTTDTRPGRADMKGTERPGGEEPGPVPGADINFDDWLAPFP
ncbi:hypothetical protein ABEF95_006588 [Exophiala dermatitidis]